MAALVPQHLPPTGRLTPIRAGTATLTRPAMSHGVHLQMQEQPRAEMTLHEGWLVIRWQDALTRATADSGRDAIGE